MADPERVIEQVVALARTWSNHPSRRSRLRRRRQRAARWIKAVLAMLFTAFVAIPAMIAGGFLLGPNGTEGLIAAPIVLMLTWSAILYWAIAKKDKPTLPKAAALPQLPANTGEWLEEQRALLPWTAQQKLDSLVHKLDEMAPQMSALTPELPAAAELKRLLSEELPELVNGYRKVPAALAKQPLYGGATPEKQLIEGLDTIDKQLTRLRERLANEDMHALATHQRYLDLKYNRKDEPE